MASLPGYGAAGVPTMVSMPNVNADAIPGSDGSRQMVVIDGTPVRVVTLAIAAALGLTALRWAGFKFNVGVSAS